MQKGEIALLFSPRGDTTTVWYSTREQRKYIYICAERYGDGRPAGRRGVRHGRETNGSNKPINVGRLKRRIFINAKYAGTTGRGQLKKKKNLHCKTV